MPTLNSLRKFLRDSGCLEERVLSVLGSTTIFIEFVCLMKRGTPCRAKLAADVRGGRLPELALAKIGRSLTRCLGRGWTNRIPEEDPFG
jgi:hypothetical protein